MNITTADLRRYKDCRIWSIGRRLWRKAHEWVRSTRQWMIYSRRQRGWRKKCAERRNTGVRLCLSPTRGGQFSDCVRMCAMRRLLCVMGSQKVSVAQHCAIYLS
jgi:hypothetical protein